MVFTSGTTGRPKGALRTGTSGKVTVDLGERLGYRVAEEVQLVGGPLYHSGPLRHATMVQSIGGTVVIMPRFDVSEWLRLVRAASVTSAFLAPTMLKRIVTDSRARTACRGSRLRCVVVSGGPTPTSVKEAAVACFGEGVLYENYGSTETGTNTLLAPDDILRKPGSSGRPIEGTQLRIVTDGGRVAEPGESGEIWVRSPMRIDRYVGTDAQLREHEGYITVGDIGYLDDAGYLYVLDRRDDVIISGGVNVYPAEVEAALHRHPGVADAAVFGLPSDEWGQTIHAAIEPLPGAVLDVRGLETHCRHFLAGYKVPRTWDIRRELPRTGGGKVRKQALRAERS